MFLFESKYVDFAMVLMEVFYFRKVVFENLKSHLFIFSQKFVSVWTSKITFV